MHTYVEPRVAWHEGVIVSIDEGHCHARFVTSWFAVSKEICWPACTTRFWHHDASIDVMVVEELIPSKLHFEQLAISRSP